MKVKSLIISLTLLLNSPMQAPLFGTESEEHRRIAQQALKAVLEEHKGNLHPFLRDLFIRNNSLFVDNDLARAKSFAEFSGHDAGKDISFARCHESGKTILQQLQGLSSSLVDEVWHKRKSTENILSAEQSDKNVIVNYLLHHLIALRFANRAGLEANREDLKVGLVYEAMAVGYLTDAFSSSHMMLFLDKFLASFQRRNFSVAHNTYGRLGLYVVNSRGNVWQAFGDNLMLWYGPTYRHILEAVMTSLKEFFQVFYSAVDAERSANFLESEVESITTSEMVASWLQSHAGPAYYENFKMPSLSLLPMPVSATWSIKTTVMDSLNIHTRFHYPQMRESGFHDPSLDEKSIDSLPSQTDLPNWIVPTVLASSTTDSSAAKLVRDEPTIASVRFIQDKKVLPSYRGLLLHTAGGFSLQHGNDFNFLLGLGYSLLDDLLLLNNPSIDFFYLHPLDDLDRHILAATVGSGLQLPKSLKVINAIRIEGGYAAGFGNGLKKSGYTFATGLEFPTIDLGFTYAGLTSRLMFQRLDVGPTLDGMYLQLIFH